MGPHKRCVIAMNKIMSMVAMVQVTYSMPTTVWIPFTLGIVLINPRATPSGLLAQYLVYMVYTPGRHGITTT